MYKIGPWGNVKKQKTKDLVSLLSYWLAYLPRGKALGLWHEDLSFMGVWFTHTYCMTVLCLGP